MTIHPAMLVAFFYACVLAAFLLGRWWNRVEIEMTESMVLELNDMRIREQFRAERTMLDFRYVPVDDGELPLFVRPSRELAA